MKLFLIAVLSLFGLVLGRLPAGIFTKCRRGDSDSNLSKCLIKSVEAARGTLKGGIPQIKFPGLDPFTMSEIPLDINLAITQLKGSATNIVAKGAGSFKIEHLKIDRQKKTAEVTLKIARLVVNCDYAVSGSKIVMMATDGTGSFKGHFNDVKADIKAKGQIDKKKGGLDYLKITNLEANVEFVGEAKIHIEPSATGVAAAAAAALINKFNAKEVLNELSPRINDQVSEIVRDYVTKILKEMPLQDLVK